MTTKKSTKRALLGSVAIIALCLVMLVGTTFAWFTDTASTSVNQIVSGNLKVDIIGANEGNKDHLEKLDFQKAAGHENEKILWEPGSRYLTQGFKIVNNGNLALKWKAEINKDNVINGKVQGEVTTQAENEKSLLDAIDFYVVTSTEADAAAVPIEEFTGHLSADEKTSEVYYIKGVMRTTAGNEFQNLTLDGITITVYAAQYTEEYDSFNNQYDKDATYATPVTSVEELTEAVAAGENVVLQNDIAVQKALNVGAGKEISIDLNGHTVTAKQSFVVARDGAKVTLTGGTVETKVAAVYATDKGTEITVNGGTYIGTAKQNLITAVKGGKVTVNGGEFTSNEFTCSPQNGGIMVINGGTFTAKDNAVVATHGDRTYAGSTITINGGTFNGNITTAGYIACGVYVANSDTVNINGGTFNITDGVGVLMRAGNTTIGKDVVINLTNTGKITEGKIGDATIKISTPSYLVQDVRSGYPGATAGFTIANNSTYDLVEYK